jgi:hypothetical protein
MYIFSLNTAIGTLRIHLSSTTRFGHFWHVRPKQVADDKWMQSALRGVFALKINIDTDPKNRLNQKRGQKFMGKLPFYSAASLVQCHVTCWTKLNTTKFLNKFIRFPPTNGHSTIAPYSFIILPLPSHVWRSWPGSTLPHPLCFVSSGLPSHTDTLQVRVCGNLVPLGAGGECFVR